jgi:hypothetical protein
MEFHPDMYRTAPVYIRCFEMTKTMVLVDYYPLEWPKYGLVNTHISLPAVVSDLIHCQNRHNIINITTLGASVV